MRLQNFVVWRHTLLASLGFVTACGGNTGIETNNTGGAVATGGAGGTPPVVTTPEGLTHRPTAEVCEAFQPSSESAIPTEYGELTAGAGGAVGTTGGAGGAAGSTATEPEVSMNFTCEFDAECTDGIHGDCVFYDRSDPWAPRSIGTSCTYGCRVDADCGEQSLCECTGNGNRCVTASCTTDADCGSGLLCIRTEYNDGCGTVRQYNCQTASDTCATNADCDKGECGFDTFANHHACLQQNCAIGRPFLIHGAERLADPVARNDWRQPSTVGHAQLTSAQHQELGVRWQQIALMEHASIAAFARFAMQLLSFGAPAHLIERTNAAMVDETRHARVAFGITSRHFGRAIGPGPLAMEGALDDDDLPSVVVNAVLEGCIGETVAAAEAHLAATAAEDPELRETLFAIAADEAQHAELAFAFVNWAVADRPELARAALETARSQVASPKPTSSGDENSWLLSHGIIPATLSAKLRRQALQEMIIPCLEAICAAPQFARAA